MFSGANQFQNLLEMDAQFCSLYGFTEAEVRETYGPYIERNEAAFQSSLVASSDATTSPAPLPSSAPALASSLSSTSPSPSPSPSPSSAVVALPTGAELEDAVIAKLIEWYDGYKWNLKQPDKILSPWSVMSFLQSRELCGYWAKTATSASTVATLSLNSREILRGFSITSADLYASISATQFLSNWRQLTFQV